MRFRRIYYAHLVSKASGWSFLKAFARMSRARSNYNLTFREYYKHDFYKRPETTAQRKAQALYTKKTKTQQTLEDVAAMNGISVEELMAGKKDFCDNYFIIGMDTYLKWEVYNMSPEEKVEMASKFLKQLEDRSSIIYDIAVKDRDSIDMAALEKKLADYRNFLEGFIAKESFDLMDEEVRAVIDSPELLEPEKLRDIFIDMELSRYILGLSHKEYLMFRLWEKSFRERMDYVPNSSHTGMMLYINGEELVDTCNEKYNTYLALKPYFNRDFVRVKSAKDYKQLEEFIRKHDKGVFKPLTQTKGEGVRCVTFSEELPSTSSRAIRIYTEELFEDYGDFIFEELIVAHPEFRKINPDAINTVRALVYNDGNEVKIDGVLLRVGRLGSFVDNGSLGGILMNADPDTGVIRTLGADQEGHFYDTHPDTGFKLYGYQIPAWDKAKKMLEGAAKMIGPGYIGWDITYDANGEWVVVEANGTPQLYGIQSTTGEGALPHFLATVGDKALEGFTRETRLRADKAAIKARNNGLYK